MTEAFHDDPANIALGFIAPEGVVLPIEDIVEKTNSLPEHVEPMSYLGEVLRDLPQGAESWPQYINDTADHAFNSSVSTLFAAAMVLAKTKGVSTENFCRPLREVPVTEENPAPWLGSITPARATGWAARYLDIYGPDDVSVGFPLVEFLNSYVTPGEDPEVKRLVYRVDPANRFPFETDEGTIAPSENITKLRQASEIIRTFTVDGAKNYPQISGIAESISRTDPDLAAALTIRAATALLETRPASPHAVAAKQAMDSLLREAIGNPNFAEQSIMVEDAIAGEIKRRLHTIETDYGLDYPSEFSDRELANNLAAVHSKIDELESILKVIGIEGLGFNHRRDHLVSKLSVSNREVSFEEWVLENYKLNPEQKEMAILSGMSESDKLGMQYFTGARGKLSNIEAKEKSRRHILKELGVDLRESPIKIGSIYNDQPSLYLEYGNFDDVLEIVRTYWNVEHEDEVYDRRKARILEKITEWVDEDTPGEFTIRDNLLEGIKIFRTDNGMYRVLGSSYNEALVESVGDGKVKLVNDGYAELTLWPSMEEINGVLSKSPEAWPVLVAGHFRDQIVSNMQLTSITDYIHKLTGVSYQPEELAVDVLNGSIKIKSDTLDITLMNAIVDEDDTVKIGFTAETMVSKYHDGLQSVKPATAIIKPADNASQDNMAVIYSRLNKLTQGLPLISRPARDWRSVDNPVSIATIDMPHAKTKAFSEEVSRRR